jgi:hypothetical protein
MNDLINAINEFALDSENAEKNYSLAVIYESIGQTASAITYFMRASELTSDKELAYECLIKTALCFERQGNRKHTVETILKNAIAWMPKRPEAYFVFSRLCERHSAHVEGYLFAQIALEVADFKSPPLRSGVEYPGMYGLIFEKAICAWWWGKGDESRTLLRLLNERYFDVMDETHKNAVQYNLPKLGVDLEKDKEIKDLLEREYSYACSTLTDINVHLPILRKYAGECNHVTEMGVRTGQSTRALLVEPITLRSYDLELDATVTDLFEKAKSIGKDVSYAIGDTRQIEIENTDMLFIDTLHEYNQLKIELNLHHHKVKKYIAFHDTGEPFVKELMPAIVEFMIEHPEWKFSYHNKDNSGFTVIERIGSV